ncbi:hypothetical protein Scep_029386 [Stephania cephalantha]|uniref:Uncharacterized protein n=1 Tax=Stephania cephalantha TaxID=152367 RepID=A0AAP0DXK1_9MAGN
MSCNWYEMGIFRQSVHNHPDVIISINDPLSGPRTKSMTMYSHFHRGMRSGCSNPPGLRCYAFTCWQIPQS